VSQLSELIDTLPEGLHLDIRLKVPSHWFPVGRGFWRDAFSAQGGWIYLFIFAVAFLIIGFQVLDSDTVEWGVLLGFWSASASLLGLVGWLIWSPARVKTTARGVIENGALRVTVPSLSPSTYGTTVRSLPELRAQVHAQTDMGALVAVQQAALVAIRLRADVEAGTAELMSLQG